VFPHQSSVAVTSGSAPSASDFVSFAGELGALLQASMMAPAPALVSPPQLSSGGVHFAASLTGFGRASMSCSSFRIVIGELNWNWQQDIVYCFAPAARDVIAGAILSLIEAP